MSITQLHTMQIAFQEICEGEQPWVALGKFMNYWFGYATAHRAELVSEPISEIQEVDDYCHRWAAYCAASVDFLCRKYAVPCPDWVYNPKYILSEAWYHLPRPDVPPSVYNQLISTTPEEFSKRNIYSSNNMFDNKWELIERYQPAIEAWKEEQRTRKARQKKFLYIGGSTVLITLAAFLLLYRLFHHKIEYIFSRNEHKEAPYRF